ncbi:MULTISPECIES: hypothetical protein [Arthrobacter]|uniref:Cobalamin-independent synthase, Catalytic domain n=2 Tax=Arthrobacter TaxID=1663 RepID=A0ABU9KJQ5_9MICC|nr:hypothetical protein [Arthrobacter sp. YJM1]MDP5227212.1 hypothetical protein [Arthrobacter sp. YJM1]
MNQTLPGLAGSQVIGSAHGAWPGTDPAEATRALRGELGSPHAAPLAELPSRGVGSDATGRSAALLAGLSADVQPHGWRLSWRPEHTDSRDHRRALSALDTDVQVLADVAGEEEAAPGPLKLQLRGPISLAASLYLHHGERVLSDHGARRDVAQALAEGVGEHLAAVRRAVPDVPLAVVVEEPSVTEALAGTIPTASGYRTLRSLPGEEVTASWRLLVDALRAAGSQETVIAVPGVEAPVDRVFDAGAEGVCLPTGTLTTRQWERLAGHLENGRTVWTEYVPLRVAAGQEARTTTALADALLRTWRELGLPLSLMPRLRLLPQSRFVPERGGGSVTPADALRSLQRVTALADALDQAVAS